LGGAVWRILVSLVRPIKPQWAGEGLAIRDGRSVEAQTFEALRFDGGAWAGFAVDGAAQDLLGGCGGGGYPGLPFSFDFVWRKHGASTVPL